MTMIVKKICCDQLHCVLIVHRLARLVLHVSTWAGPGLCSSKELSRWCGAECMGDNSHSSLQLTGSTILLIILIWLHNVMVIRTSQHHHLLTKWCTHGPAFHSILRPGDEDDQQF